MASIVESGARGTTLVTALPAVVYNSRRIPPAFSLDSSDIEVLFSVSEAFVAQVDARALAARDADPYQTASDEDVLDGVLAGLVGVHLLYFDRTVPRVFITHADGTVAMEPVAQPRTRLEFDVSRRLLRVFIARTLPISGNHAGRPFRFAFTVGNDALETPAFQVLSKQALPSTPRKNIKPPAVGVLDAARVASMQAIHAALAPFNAAVPTRVEFASPEVVEAPPSGSNSRRRPATKKRMGVTAKPAAKRQRGGVNRRGRSPSPPCIAEAPALLPALPSPVAVVGVPTPPPQAVPLTDALEAADLDDLFSSDVFDGDFFLESAAC